MLIVVQQSGPADICTLDDYIPVQYADDDMEGIMPSHRLVLRVSCEVDIFEVPHAQ